jgi:hypothetical protein
MKKFGKYNQVHLSLVKGKRKQEIEPYSVLIF